MDLILMTEEEIENQVLEFFRQELSIPISEDWKEIALGFDTPLQDYALGDELMDAINDYDEKFGVDMSVMSLAPYYPWENLPLLTRWFKARKEEVEKRRKPLTVRMFAESAIAQLWLYD
ncbi:DUF1493 family protein [Rahnella ecdela]|uniref:DUF1493 family protein n=1 Tax=Rahnella ecdela TaxID=2816250 RepID=A0ABS6LFT3_9GAMM|nr:DUF1493 family protein [Rahnella ecdela]MBU9845797.1 DUF1493 family protein [Rahnella ecdela]